MHRVSLVASISLALSLGCSNRTGSLDTGEASVDESGSTESGDGDGGDGDGDGDEDDGDGDGDGEPGDGDPGDGDGDPGLLGPCSWVPAPPSDCDLAFEPIEAEPPLQVHDSAIIREIAVSARADAVELMWKREYFEGGDTTEERSFLTSNAQGPWQHEFLAAFNCGARTCGPVTELQIRGSANRTQLSPPYLRREGGQWLRADIEPADFMSLYVYFDPNLFAVGPDDRSYFMGVGDEEQFSEEWLWSETDQGCHRPIWEFERDTDECRRSDVTAMAVDGAGFLHMIGTEEVDEYEHVLVHWVVDGDSVERTELAPLPMYPSQFMQFDIDDSNELHVCHWANYEPTNAEIFYAHGHDADDWVMLGIKDPDHDETSTCKLAIAADGTAWLTWVSSSLDPMEPFRVASVVDDVVTQEVIDVDVWEWSAGLSVDPMGRPWVAYVPRPNDGQTIEVAHKEGGQWIIEQLGTPP
jgi:hypothetical protein